MRTLVLVRALTRSASLLLILLPAFAVSCTGTAPPLQKIRLQWSAPATAHLRCLDVFFFNDDALRRLDAYQRFDAVTGTAVAASRSGPKIVVALANATDDPLSWADINSYDRLMAWQADFAREDPLHPVMSGVARVGPGTDRSCSMTLRPLRACIELSSLSADFHGRPYEGAVLEDVRVYLVNIAGLCPAFCEDVVRPGGILNAGALKEADMASLTAPQMVSERMEGPIGTTVRHPDLRLQCYPNSVQEEGLGAPFTRLVIEGRLLGTTYYYPIDVGRGPYRVDGLTEGILRGHTYRLDVTLTRRGALDPDTPLETGAVLVRMDGGEWTAAEETLLPY